MMEKMEIYKNESPEPDLSSSLLSSPLKLAHYAAQKIHYRMKLCSKKIKKKSIALSVLYTGHGFVYESS